MYLRDAIRLNTNDVIAASEVVNDLDWLNRNPFRRADAIYEPDRREYGFSSLLLRVDEKRQWSADAGYENSGSEITSEDRITTGVTWGKAFGLQDNLFRYAFTFDPTLEFLRAHSASYYLPLPWRHGFRLTGYYLDDKGNVNPTTTLKGSAWQISPRYEIPLPSIGKYQHEASIGLDYKKSENNLFFGVSSPVNTPTEIFQVAAGYSSTLTDPWGRNSFGIQGYFSPGDVTSLNTDEDFDKVHTGAKAHYVYGRFNFERDTRLWADFGWIFRAVGQVSDGNLLPSEQLGLGGFATIRGYEEREVNGDQGFFISNEIRTPNFSVLRLFTSKLKVEDELQFLGFWDYGEAGNVHLTAGERQHTWLSSVGAGLRFKMTDHFALRFDYGWQLMDTGLTLHDSRAHVGVVATY